MQTQDFNPDTRPLPAGWTQHFEPTKQLWCYVRTSVMPPTVSFRHPADMVATNKGVPCAPMNSVQMPPTAPSMQPRSRPQSSGGLTFAQKLYASSMGSSLGPMANSPIPHHPKSQLPTIHIRNLPTPPPSSSPPPGSGTHFPSTPLYGSGMSSNPSGSQLSYPSHQTSSHNVNHSSPGFISTPSSAPPLLDPHRTNTFQAPVLPPDVGHPQRHKAFTYNQGASQHSTSVVSSVTSPRPTRHLVTTARPPDQQSSSSLSPLVLEPPAAIHSAPAILSPPPASSILFSQSTGTALPPPLTAVQPTPTTPPNISSILSIPSGTAYRPPIRTSPMGRVSSAAATQIAGGVGSLADSVVSNLQSVLLTPGTGVDLFSLQAVIQGRSDADYQRIINALIKLHQQQQQQFSLMKLQILQPPQPAIDHQALIAEIQRLQSQQQQQHQQQHQHQHQFTQLQASPQFQAAQQQQQQTAAQQYQALVQQQFQQQAAIQQQQVLAQQQQAAQYRGLLQQQQAVLQAQAQAQQSQALLNAYARPPQPQQFQQQQRPTTVQSTVQTFLGAYKEFQHLNQQLSQGAGDTGVGQPQPSFDPTLLYSTDGDGVSDSLGNPGGNGGQDSGNFLNSDFLSFNQDGFDMTSVDISNSN